MHIFDKNFKEILSSQLFCVIGGLFAGTLLAAHTGTLLVIPGMLILLPGFLAMRGNISGTFSARLSSGLFLKVIKPGELGSRLIRSNLLASFFLALIVSFVLGLLAFYFNYFIIGIYTPWIIMLPIVAGIIANAIEIVITLAMTIYIFKKGHDPNNIMGPFVTSTGDITSILALVLAMMLI